MYEGAYEDGVKSGKGRMAYPDKSVYEGECERRCERVRVRTGARRKGKGGVQ